MTSQFIILLKKLPNEPVHRVTRHRSAVQSENRRSTAAQEKFLYLHLRENVVTNLLSGL
jgi:hypothetical protein